MRLIDADALARELLSLAWLGCYGVYYKGMADERDATLQRITDAPTIELVKCGECKQSKQDRNIGLYCNIFKQYRNEDDYCSYGERLEAQHESEN